MEQIDIGQGFHTLMSLLDMVQMDMGQGFHTMMRLVDRIFAPMSEETHEFRESLPTRRAQSSLTRSLSW